MTPASVRYFCTSCGNESLKWEGRCPACGEWNALAEAPRRSEKRRAGAGSGVGKGTGDRAPAALREAESPDADRLRLEMGELDLVLGGGLVPGSLVLLGGAPGIGKSTLLLQLAACLQERGLVALYASGEESAAQVRMRAARIGDAAGEVVFVAETEVGTLLEHARDLGPDLLCVDSIQTLHSDSVDSAPGNVSQVRECAAHLQAFAKESGTPTFLVGHVTKEGGLAGPRTLEHVVDTVLQFDGERTLEHRILRAVKNRFGGVGEVAVFRMAAEGLLPVKHPSDLFLSDRPEGVSGSAVAVPLQGSRPVLAEVQALTARARFSTPQRVATGFPGRRLAMLLAVLERRAGLPLGDADIFVNVIGGLKLLDPAADLAVLAALISAELDRPTPSHLAFAGEVGLGGEVRGVTRADRRVREAERAGLGGLVLPESAAAPETDMALHPVEDVGALTRLLRAADSGARDPADGEGQRSGNDHGARGARP